METIVFFLCASSTKDDYSVTFNLLLQVVNKQKNKKKKNSSSRSQRMTLSPYQKWRRFGRLPVKFVLHIMIVIALTAQASFPFFFPLLNFFVL